MSLSECKIVFSTYLNIEKYMLNTEIFGLILPRKHNIRKINFLKKLHNFCLFNHIQATLIYNIFVHWTPKSLKNSHPIVRKWLELYSHGREYCWDLRKNSILDVQGPFSSISGPPLGRNRAKNDWKNRKLSVEKLFGIPRCP